MGDSTQKRWGRATMSRQREIYNTNDQCQRATGEKSHQTKWPIKVFLHLKWEEAKRKEKKKESIFWDIKPEDFSKHCISFTKFIPISKAPLIKQAK